MKVIILIDEETLSCLPMQGFTLYCAGDIDEYGKLIISARTKKMMDEDLTIAHQVFHLTDDLP